MNELSTIVLSKFVLLLVLFLLCELGFGPRFRSSAMELPPEEVNALYYVLSSSGITPLPVVTASFCQDQPSLFKVIIKCNNTFDDNNWHITIISMESQFLRGFIDAEVAQLTYLETLDLSNNYLYGAIPESLGNLSHLTKLDLSNNLLTGSIPRSLGNLTNLTELSLHLNFLHGTIPCSLGELSNLTYLELWSNRLSGKIPCELGNLLKLQTLDLDDNELIGELPRKLGNLINLEYLWLESNSFTGELPTEYEKFKKIIVFAVAGNSLKGPIPKYIANWVNLLRLHLLGNNFQGKLPDEIFRMPSLTYLVVSDLNNVTEFYFPNSTNLTNIYTLVLRNCGIMGEIPSDIGNRSPSLEILDLSFNNLSGEIPDSFQNLSLSRMFLTSNNLSGKIRDWINQTVIDSGDLSDNNFTFEGEGKPDTDSGQYKTFSNQSKINVYPINRASLYQIGNESCDGKKLKDSLFINAGGEETEVNGKHYDADNIITNTLYFSPENHWASVCTGIFIVTTTNRSDYVKNITCGLSVSEAPLYAKARLCPHSLAYYGFCLHKGNYTVTLHFAEIVYSKDEDHSSTGKRVFDVYIQGNRVLKDFNIKKEAGGPDKIWAQNFTANVSDDHALEIRLLWAGKGSIYNHPALNGPLISAISVTPNFKVREDRGSSTVKIVGIVIAAVSALLLLLAFFMWRMGWVGDRELRVANIELRGKFYSLKQVKDATGNFHPKNEIGKGQFGIVYKAQLPDKNIVAVKKLYMKQKVERIGTEVYAFKEKNLRHENIVELLAISSRDDLNLIIYEYMERGSLEQVLFDSTSEVQLDWQTRVKISLGIAKGLNCIHAHGYIHRNVKASNILLDGDLNAKVSDLGLAKLYNEQNPYWFLREIGTRVNTAPEYATRQADTNKADVYSYGIVLLEIVSGKSNSKHEQNQETAFLSNTALVKHSDGKPLDLVDPKLQNNYNRRQAIEILDLAIECISSSLTLRPTMSEVVNKLEKMLFPGVRDETEIENPVEEMIQRGDSAAAEEGRSAQVL